MDAALFFLPHVIYILFLSQYDTTVCAMWPCSARFDIFVGLVRAQIRINLLEIIKAGNEWWKRDGEWEKDSNKINVIVDKIIN